MYQHTPAQEIKDATKSDIGRQWYGLFSANKH